MPDARLLQFIGYSGAGETMSVESVDLGSRLVNPWRSPESVGVDSADIFEVTDPDPSIRIVIADDDVLMRSGLASLLERPGQSVVGVAGETAGLLKLVREHNPDLVIVDDMPPTHTVEGLQAAEQIRMDPVLLQELTSARYRDDPFMLLSKREFDVLALMAEGRSNLGIAHELWVAEGTVEKHVRSILTKLNLSSSPYDHRRVLAVIAFLRTGSADRRRQLRRTQKGLTCRFAEPARPKGFEPLTF